MSKIILALLLIGVLLAVTDARRRRNRGPGRWWRFLGRDVDEDLGRDFRRWMRRDGLDAQTGQLEGDESNPDNLIGDDIDAENVEENEENNAGLDEPNLPDRSHGHWRRRCRGNGCSADNWRRRLPWYNQWRQREDRNDENSNSEGNGNVQRQHRRNWRERMRERLARRRQRTRQEMARRRNEWRQKHRRRINRRRQDRRHGHRGRHRYNIGLGHRGNRWFNFDLDFGYGGRNWWEGPNVCTSTEESDNITVADISPHNEVYTKTCDDSDTAYRCETTVIKMLTKSTRTEVRECCTGYTRKSRDFGCPTEVNLYNITQTARNLQLNQFIRASESVNLASQLDQGNFTVFAPVDAAFEDLDELIESDTNIQLQDMGSVVVVSQPLTDSLVADLKNVLLGHVSFDVLKTSRLNDEQLIETGSPFKSKIRINFYDTTDKLMTANCKRVKSRDNVATNGVIHVVEELLEPVSESLLDIISKDPQLSYLKTAIGRSGLGQTFREDGQFTIFAPTDNAFRKIDQRLLSKLLAGDKCLTKVLQNHILPNVICSAAIQGRKTSPNLLKNHLQLERDDDDKLFVEGVQIVDSDVMATNGVLYLIDEVLLPEDALSVLDIADRNNASTVLGLIQSAGLEKTLQEAENITFFVPSNEAFEKLGPIVLEDLQRNPSALQSVLKYHVSPSVETCHEFYNDYELDTLYDDRKIRINEYSMFPFGRQWVRTAQCAPIRTASVKACNGVVHIIDKVLIPPKGNVVDVLALDNRFSKLVEYVKNTGLADTLQEDGPYTIFAPTNDAFDEVDEDIMTDLLNDSEELKTVLKGHVIKDSLCCAGIFDEHFFGRKVRTLSREKYRVELEGGNPTIDGHQITECDLTATNGVVHVINEVLIPRRMINSRRRWHDDFWDFDFDWDF